MVLVVYKDYLFLPLSLFFPFPLPSNCVLPVFSGVDTCWLGASIDGELGVASDGEVDATGDGEAETVGDGEVDAAGDTFGLSAGFRATTKPVTAVRMAAVAVIMPGTV